MPTPPLNIAESDFNNDVYRNFLGDDDDDSESSIEQLKELHKSVKKPENKKKLKKANDDLGSVRDEKSTASVSVKRENSSGYLKAILEGDIDNSDLENDIHVFVNKKSLLKLKLISGYTNKTQKDIISVILNGEINLIFESIKGQIAGELF